MKVENVYCADRTQPNIKHTFHLSMINIYSYFCRTDCVQNEKALRGVKEERNILHTIKRRKASWFGHMNCRQKRVIEGKIEGRIEVAKRWGNRRKQLLYDLKGTRGYWKLNEEALDRTLRRTGFGRRYGPDVRPSSWWWCWYVTAILKCIIFPVDPQHVTIVPLRLVVVVVLLLLLLLFLLQLALQPTVDFGLSNNVPPFFPIYHQLSPSSHSQHLKISFCLLFPSCPGLRLLLVPSSSWVKIFLGILSSSILSRWPNQLILCPFIHFTIFSPLFISSSSRFVLLIHYPFF